MRCPFCGHIEDKVVDSRESREGEAIRRRRECLGCGRRFTSYERVEEVPIVVVKKDGRREPFDRAKLLKGLVAACQKRPVSLARLEELATDIQAKLLERSDREIRARDLGASPPSTATSRTCRISCGRWRKCSCTARAARPCRPFPGCPCRPPWRRRSSPAMSRPG